MLTKHKDCDYYILTFLEDTDIFNLGQVNKQFHNFCQNDCIWIELLIRKYTYFCLPYKSKDKGWKTYYLELKYFYSLSSNINKSMKHAARYGAFDTVNYLASIGANHWNQAMKGAAEGDQQHLVEFFISKGASYWNWGLKSSRNLSMANFFISKGADPRNTVLR